jgi:uncharacterized protein (TIGR02001 family)
MMAARALAMASVALLPVAAIAAEQELAPEAPVAEPAGAPAFDLALGVAFTSDYISRGISQTDGRPAIQGYVEPRLEIPELGTAYVNVWASNVDFGGDEFDGAEIDVAVGLRPQIGPLALDFGYVHYFFTPEDISPDYGEIFAKADYNVNDMFTVGGRVFHAPDFSQSGDSATWLAGGVRVPLPHDFSAYAGIGYQFFENDDAFEQLAWMAGVSYTWKAVTLDLRYWDSDLSDDECAVRSGFSDGCGSRFAATISFDTTFATVRDWLSGN